MPDVLADGVIRLGVDESFLQQSLDAAKALIVKNVTDISKASSRLLLTNQGSGGTPLAAIGGGGRPALQSSSVNSAYRIGMSSASTAIALRSSSIGPANSAGNGGSGGVGRWRFNDGNYRGVIGSSSVSSGGGGSGSIRGRSSSGGSGSGGGGDGLITEGDKKQVKNIIGTAIKSLVATAAAVTTAAAMSGSTTFDTLTGSVKMLSLAAGKNTQDAVLGISSLIQKLAKNYDSIVPSGGTGTLIGAGAGYAVGGVPGAIVGGGGGFLAERLGALETYDQKRKRNVNSIMGDLSDDAKADAVWEQRFALRKDLQRGKLTVEERNAATRQLTDIDEAIKRKEGGLGIHKGEGMLTAGLGGQASFSGADVREKAQMGIYGAGGPLGAANNLEELKLNLQAIQSGSFVPNWQPTVNPGNVAPPGWFN